jgi:hypothetical protein
LGNITYAGWRTRLNGPGICEVFFPNAVDKVRANIRGRSMLTISKGRTPLTLINVFTVTPEKQDELIALLTDVSEHNVRHHKGFISASLHRWQESNDVRPNGRASKITRPCVKIQVPHRRWRKPSR